MSNLKHVRDGRGAPEPKRKRGDLSRYDSVIATQAREASVSRFREEYRRAKAGLAAADVAPSHRLRGLRIRLRIFLDEHRRALPRDEAAALRALIDDVDRMIARL